MFRVRIIVDDSIEVFTFETEEDAIDFKENRLDQGSVFLVDEVTNG